MPVGRRVYYGEARMSSSHKLRLHQQRRIASAQNVLPRKTFDACMQVASKQPLTPHQDYATFSTAVASRIYIAADGAKMGKNTIYKELSFAVENDAKEFACRLCLTDENISVSELNTLTLERAGSVPSMQALNGARLNVIQASNDDIEVHASRFGRQYEATAISFLSNEPLVRSAMARHDRNQSWLYHPRDIAVMVNHIKQRIGGYEPVFRRIECELRNSGTS